MANVHEKCYFFVFFSAKINLHHVFKMFIIFGTYMHVYSPECHWSMAASKIVRCSMLCQTFTFVSEKNE